MNEQTKYRISTQCFFTLI